MVSVVPSLWGYAIAGYVMAAGAIGLYVVTLHARSRRARDRAAAIAGRRRTSTPP